MYLGMILIIIIIFIELMRKKTIYSPVFLFSSLFFFMLFLVLLRLYNISNFSARSIYVIQLGVIFFAIGSYLVELIFKVIKNNSIIFQKNKVEIKRLTVNWFWLYSINTIVSLSVLVISLSVLKLMINGTSYTDIRSLFLGYSTKGVVEISGILKILINYVASPGLYALIPFSIYYLVNRKNTKFYTITFINLVLYVLCTGGRIILVYTIIQFLIAISYSGIKIPKKIKKTMYIFIIFSFTLIIIISNLRSSKNLLYVFYAYFSGPVVLLSKWIEMVDNAEIWGMGFSFLYPLTYALNLIFGFLGLDITFLQNIVTWQGGPQKYWLQVFPDMSMNAFSTLFYFFYLDFRYFGVILFSTIFGSTCSFIYNKAYIEKNENYFIMYLLLVKALFGSFIIWQLGSTSFFVTIVLVLLSLNKKHH